MSQAFIDMPWYAWLATPLVLCMFFFVALYAYAVLGFFAGALYDLVHMAVSPAEVKSPAAEVKQPTRWRQSQIVGLDGEPLLVREVVVRDNYN